MTLGAVVRAALFAAAAPLLAQDGALRVGPNVLVSGASPDRQRSR